MKPYICKQCGAPMKNPYKCEYCDTVYQNDSNNCLDFEILQAEQRIRDLQAQIIADRLRLSQNMRHQTLDFVPPTPTQNSRFRWFRSIAEKIGGKRND